MTSSVFQIKHAYIKYILDTLYIRYMPYYCMHLHLMILRAISKGERRRRTCWFAKVYIPIFYYINIAMYVYDLLYSSADKP